MSHGVVTGQPSRARMHVCSSRPALAAVAWLAAGLTTDRLVKSSLLCSACVSRQINKSYCQYVH